MRTSHLRPVVTALAVVAATGVGSTLAVPSAHAASSVSAATKCSGFVTVTGSSVKVHKTSHLSSTAVGQLNKGARFNLCSDSYPTHDGYTWAYGYGYNGKTKLTGWVVTKYLSFP